MVNRDMNYHTLMDDSCPNRIEGKTCAIELEDTPRSSGVMIHIVPERSKAQWNHIDDLDSFFTRMYNYHQKHGFTVILIDEMFKLFKIVFVTWLLTFTIHCVNHPVLFGDEHPFNSTTSKVYLIDAIVPLGQCIESFGIVTYTLLFIATLYFMIRLLKTIFNATQYSDIKKFYNTALVIDDNDLENITWHEVKKRLREVQSEQHMCIDKEQLTELDIYHRILRFENYMVALMNANLLPTKFRVPLLGEKVTLSRGLLYNIDFILFRGPGSPFQNNYQLHNDYTIRNNQLELTQRLSKLIFWVALFNLMAAPAIFVWQLLFFSFSYANVLKKEPGTLGIRTWSNYGRLYVRHFNELDHELEARLNRAYEHADKYLSSFSSPIITVLAKNILFLSGGVLMLLLCLGIYKEFVLQVEHVLTIITILSAIGLICRSLIPDEHLVWCPEYLMNIILSQLHYLPSDWKSQSHTAHVRNQFGNFFQFKGSYILNEICSPIVTPFVLLFVFYPKANEIVKFFRSFTVTVRGVGNVCSFAQMDVRKYGNPHWQLQKDTSATENEKLRKEEGNYYQVENGKTELSLIRFTLTNPEWMIPAESQKFLRQIRQNAFKELNHSINQDQNAIARSLISFGAINKEFSAIANSIFDAYNIQLEQSKCLSKFNSDSELMNDEATSSLKVKYSKNSVSKESKRSNCRKLDFLDKGWRQMRVSKTDVCLNDPSETLLFSISNQTNLPVDATNLTVADMCLSTLYLHEICRKNTCSKTQSMEGDRHKSDEKASMTVESTPLLQSQY